MAVHSLYVGTYQAEGRAGIFHLRFDSESGRLSRQSAVSSVAHPSFLALHPTGRHLYAASEAPGGVDGEICAFDIDPNTGDLAPLGRRPAHGRATCHVAVDAAGRHVLATNYGSPTVVAYPLLPDGALGESATVHRHAGRGVHPRQSEPHPHSVNVDPTNRFLYCPDLGLDRVVAYRLDAATGPTVHGAPPPLATAPGAGPRHLAFHPSLPRIYVVNEIDCTVLTCSWDRESGALEGLGAVSTLPAGFTGPSHCADIHVHPTGRFLYASNRGHDSIAVFRLDPVTGLPSPAGHAATRGRTPRNFALDPTGSFLLAANQDSGTIVVLRIEEETGSPLPTGVVAEVPTPVCLKFAPVSARA